MDGVDGAASSGFMVNYNNVKNSSLLTTNAYTEYIGNNNNDNIDDQDQFPCQFQESLANL